MNGAPTLAFGLLVAPGVAFAQVVRQSQPATITQMLGPTKISITYNRPNARGRPLFGPGGVVAWGRVWNPGADEATTIALSGNVLVAGQPLAAGKYSLWAIPEPEQWTLIFSRAAEVFHVPYPGAVQDALRITLKPTRGPFMESLAVYFPVADRDHAVLDLHWGETLVEIPITRQ